MTCPRCGTDAELQRNGWCKACDAAYDGWSRQHAADIIPPLLGGAVVVLFGAMALPFFGLSSVVAAASVFAGFGVLVSGWRLKQRKRRRQFLAAAALPRAYLPEKI